MRSDFVKISSVASLTGGTKWYLSGDCLLAAKRTMYVVEYRRFYLHDLESILVWPSRSWRWRVILPGVLLAAVGVTLGVWVNSTAGEIFDIMAVAWVALELALGPTARSRIQITGASLELPLVARTRRAQKVLAKIDAVVRANREVVDQPIAPASAAESPESVIQTNSVTTAAEPIVAAADPNGS